MLNQIATPQQSLKIVTHLKGSPPTDVAEATPIHIREVFWGLVQSGHLEIALEMIRGRYGPMVNMFDNPTIWEGWRRFTGENAIVTDEDYEQRDDRLRPAGERSLVHGGTAPALLLSREVLGVKSVGAGFRECRIEVPELESVEWARGVFPSVRGDIKVDWRRKGGKMLLEVELPADLKSTLVIPAGARTVYHNGKRVARANIVVTGGTHRVEVE